MKIFISLALILLSFFSFADCFRVDQSGKKTPYTGEDLRTIGYTFDLKDQKTLMKTYPDLKLVQHIFTGKLIPCSGESCDGMRHISCSDSK